MDGIWHLSSTQKRGVPLPRHGVAIPKYMCHTDRIGTYAWLPQARAIDGTFCAVAEALLAGMEVVCIVNVLPMQLLSVPLCT